MSITEKENLELESENQLLKIRIKKLEEAAGRVFNWYFIFGEDNDAAKGHLANLGNVLKKK